MYLPGSLYRTNLIFTYATNFHPISYLRPNFSPSLLVIVVTQIRGHIAGSSPPIPTTVRALHFYREKILAVSSLVDSRRIVLTHARHSQQLIFFFLFANKFKISPQRDSISRTNTHSSISSIRGLPLVNRADRLLNTPYQ